MSLADYGWTLQFDEELKGAAWTPQQGAHPIAGGRHRIWGRDLPQGRLVIQIFQMPDENHYHAVWGIHPWMSQPMLATRGGSTCFTSEAEVATTVIQMALDLFAQVGVELSKFKQEISPYGPIFSMRPTGGTIQ